MSDDVGERFARAIAVRDAGMLSRLLAPDVDFRGLTPRRFWEADDAALVIEVLLGSWFEPQDEVVAVTALERGEDVGEVHRIGYRFTVESPSGSSTVEQQAYYRVEEDRLTYLRVVCSGFQPRS